MAAKVIEAKVVEAAKEKALPIELSPGQLAVIRSLPELCGFAVPGEELGGWTCEPHHYLAQFWPLLCQGVSSFTPSWDLGAPLLYDIDTTEESDEGSSSFSGVNNHMSRVVRLRMEKGSTYGAAGGAYHTATFDSYGKDTDGRLGMLCRGNSQFLNDPFQAMMMLRMWHVQTQENHGSCGALSSNKAWWNSAVGTSWLTQHPLAKCIVVPTQGPKASVAHALVVPLDPSWVARKQAGESGEPYPFPGDIASAKAVVGKV